MKPRFKVVIPAYNAMPWLEKALQSVEVQTYKNYDVCVIDDASTQEGQKELINTYCTRNGWKAIYNTENKGALANIVRGVEELKCEDEDVVLTLDGDDWLYNDLVFEKVAGIYDRENIWLTYGQYVGHRTGGIGCSRRQKRRVRRRRTFRKVNWAFSHLRTFKHKLWRHIKDSDLRDPSGEYYRVTWDLAFMYPMLEMAGTRIRYIPEVLYVYNDDNPISDFRVRLEEQEAVAEQLKKKEKYPRLKKLIGRRNG